MRKRERENPCGICGHYHKHNEGEVCGICGHRVPGREEKLGYHISAFPSEVLPQFLYLGSYNHASRAQLLKAQGVTHILNEQQELQAQVGELSQARSQKGPINSSGREHYHRASCLVGKQINVKRARLHCMSGKSSVPEGWSLQQSYQWVKEKRPSPDNNQQLHDYELKIYGSAESSPLVLNPVSGEPFGFGFQKSDEANPVPAFCNLTTDSIVVPSTELTFGANNPSGVE